MQGFDSEEPEDTRCTTDSCVFPEMQERSSFQSLNNCTREKPQHRWNSCHKYSKHTHHNLCYSHRYVYTYTLLITSMLDITQIASVSTTSFFLPNLLPFTLNFERHEKKYMIKTYYAHKRHLLFCHIILKKKKQIE